MNSISSVKFPPLTNQPIPIPIAKLENSEKRSCGKKHDVLVKLHGHFSKYPLEGVEVPLPYGIATEELEPFLRKNAPLFFEYWAELQELYCRNNSGYLHFFEEPKVIQLITQAQNELKKALIHFSLPSEIAYWLDDSRYYMVRSSGAEDGKKTANAGGNLSCNYVSIKEISKRIGDVIASYLDKRSLINQIKSGENPFSTSLSLSVTIQDLMGESIGGETDSNKIPVSVVLFTNEPLYVGKESFRVMKLSAGYGHGDGVVGKRGVLTDTAFVLQSMVNPSELYEWYDNQEKPERLAPLCIENETRLELIANPEELIHQRALAHPMIKRLFELGLKVEELFDGPTDMELVIKNEKIYIVQARPINRSSNFPTYLDLDSSELQHTTDVKILVPGGSHALIIDSPEQIYVEDTLEKASDGLRDSHQLVVVREDEPLNSHPIIRMTEQGMPCLYQKDGIVVLTSELQETKNGEKTVLVSCVQQGIVALATDPSKVVIKNGYISHPVPLSCPPELMTWRQKKKDFPLELQALLKRIRLEQTKEAAYKIFQKLVEEPLFAPIAKKIDYAPLRPLAYEMQKRVLATLQELEKTLSIPKGDHRLQILFYAKALETLLWGTGYSVIRIQELSDAMSHYEQKLSSRCSMSLKSDAKKAVFAEESLIKPLLPETGEAWINFLVTIETEHSPAEIESLKKLLHSIGNARSIWLTFFFDRVRKTASNSADLLKSLLEGFDSTSQVFVDQLRKKEKIMDSFKTELFADPAAEQYAWAQLLTIIKVFEDLKFTETFLKSSPLAKIIASQILAKAVALYDKSVKTFKTSPQYPIEVKAKLFREMLFHYLSLLKIVALELVGEGKFPNQGLTLNAYIEKLEEILKQPWDQTSKQALAQQLASSPEFSVLAAMFGSGALFMRHLPVTLEDLFTLIHQNLNACISFLLKNNIRFQGITPPRLFHETIDRVRQFRTTQLIGVEQDDEQLIIRFNAPLRNHSSTFQLIYREDTVFLSAQLLGEARNRWTLTHQYLKVLDALNIQHLAKRSIQRGDVLNFTWCFENKEQFAQALSILDVIYDFSINENVNFLHRDILDRLSNHNGSSQAQNEAYEHVALLAEEFIYASNVIIKSHWSQLLQQFVKQGRIDSKIIEIVLRVAEDPNLYSKLEAFALLCSLLDKGKAFEEAALVLEKFIYDSEGAVRRYGLLLLGRLLEKAYNKEKAISLVKKLVNDTDNSVFEELIILWDKLNIEVELDSFSKSFSQEKKLEAFLHAHCLLLRKKLEVEQASLIIIQIENENDPVILSRTLKLLSKLVVTGKVVEQSIAIARKLVDHTDLSVRVNVARLLNALLIQEKIFEDVIWIAERLAQDNAHSIKNEIFSLLSKLIHKDLVNEKMIGMIKALANDSELGMKKASLGLLIRLARRKFAYADGVEIAQKLHSDEDAFVKLEVIRLLEILLSQNQMCEKIFLIIKGLSRDPDILVQNGMIPLFEKLIDIDQVSEELILILQMLVNDQTCISRERILGLFKLLIDKGIAVKEAVSIAEQHVNNLEASMRCSAISVLETFALRDTTDEESVAIFSRILFTSEPNLSTISTIHRLFVHFINVGKACKAIANTSEQLIILSDQFRIFYGFQCLIELAKMGYMPEKIIDIAKRFATDSNSIKGQCAKRLIEALKGKDKNSNDDSDTV
jgi:hypothetical protein